MTLGYGPPRATCPHCLNEGTVAEDQTGQTRGHNRVLTRYIRFTCEQKHAWLVEMEIARLTGAFLDRQPAA